MPWIRTPANITVRKLFSGNQSEAMKRARMTNGTFYARKKHPGDIKLSELGPLAADLNDEEIIEIVRAWK